MKIATWNVNSIRARLPLVLRWLEDCRPDVALLQETKTLEMPALELAQLGYREISLGQKSYNGVALLSLHPVDEVVLGLPGDTADEQARYVQARVQGVTVASIYLPNGNPVDENPAGKFAYKLGWFARLHAHAEALLATETPVVLAGDYNVIPQPEDCYDPRAWEGDALYRPESRGAWASLVNLGYTDAFRAINRQPGQYTFWDYQAGRWQRDQGIRIDHALLSPEAADRLAACHIDRTPRGWERASDHTPLVVELDG